MDRLSIPEHGVAARLRDRVPADPARVGRIAERSAAATRPIAFAAACGGGLLLLSYGLHLSRSDPGSTRAELWFWLGLMGILLPCAAVLAAARAERRARVGAVVTLALLLYLVKVVHDPFAFTYADEAVHFLNAGRIEATGRLFQQNPVVPVTGRFPGLEAVTAGIASLTGMSVFASGLVGVGAARVVLLLALFHLAERVSGSARVAGITVLVYAGNPNFLFWSAQFSYESLGLPLVALTLFALTVRMEAPRRPGVRIGERAGLTAVVVLVAAAVVVTHHVSAFVLSGTVLAICLVAAARPRTRRLAPVFPALLIGAATLGWLFAVAPTTVEYLSPVLGRAFHQTVGALTGNLHFRAPFDGHGPAATVEAPAWERVVALVSVAVTVVGIGGGVLVVGRRLRSHPLAVTFALAGVVYVGVLPMRLIPAAWETSNRASEFLFFGVSFLLAAATVAALVRLRRPWALPVVVALAGVLTVGGVAAGWPPRVLLAPPYRVGVGAASIESESRAAARASRLLSSAGARFVAPEGDGRVLLTVGRTAFVTSAPFDAASVLFGPRVTAGVAATLAEERIRYVVVDRRQQGDDSMQGFFFVPPDGPRIAPAAVAKYDGYPGLDRLADTGDIALYDVGRLWGAPR
jgi:hypothetical protein